MISSIERTPVSRLADIRLMAQVEALDWSHISSDLDIQGYAIISKLVTPEDCHGIRSLYTNNKIFRSHVYMHRHGFGHGEYKYFGYPLPVLVDGLRGTLYPRLAPIANRWHEQLRLQSRFPPRHDEFIARCHLAGQKRPTPLLLRYASGDHNCMHQDLYGEHVFPLQALVLLSEPGSEFSGGEFVLTEQRPRMQSRVEVIPLSLGDAVVFAVQHRPAPGTGRFYRVNMRHGVSRVRTGLRHTLGIIFHDAA